MSQVRNRVCRLILQENFGSAVAKVGIFLLEKGPSPIRYILSECHDSSEEVKKILCVLIQHNMVTFEKNKKGFIEYTIDGESIMYRLRFIRYIYCAKTLYGDAAELLIEELLQRGKMLMSEVITSVTGRLNEALEASGKPAIQESLVKDKFTNLVKSHFVQRCPSPLLKENRVVGTETTENEEDLFKIPDIRKRKKSINEDMPAAKRHKSEEGSSTQEKADDDGIYWRVNCQRFHQLIRDQIIVEAINKKIDMRASEILRTIFRLSETRTAPMALSTNAVSAAEILHALPKELGVDRKLLDTYLSIITDDSTDFVMKVGDSGGGMFSVNMYKCMLQLTKAHIESVVQERFGSKSLRIFRLLLLKKHLEQKQIEDFAMISAKEAKELLYMMFSQNFVSITEISKTADHAPSRTYYIFTVDIHQVARMVLERCYKAIFNAMLKRIAELTEHRRLLEKQERCDAIIASLVQGGAEDEQKEEIEQTITPPERELIKRVKRTVQMLDQSEIQIEEAIFVLETFLFYKRLNTAQK
ncbi:hypothetical protein FSP39_019429 [Pinctada imbricata]|uniref:DNA-directed RNA polymerase III subunit RPC3 n=1 Tax=Pinctada imbricata TaxID=66713 RepID=A0AA88Y5T8_PINIB|nr:hypothetical protein FSP39_019429 [Pinctada imbricata]